MALSPDEVAKLADLAGLTIPAEDLEHVTAALVAHHEFVAPLLEFDLADDDSAVTVDPRWRE